MNAYLQKQRMLDAYMLVCESIDDKVYGDAVENGNLKTANTILRESAHRQMPNTKVVAGNGFPKIVYHGTVKTKKEGGSFTSFEYRGINGGYKEFYFTDKYDVAAFFAGNGIVDFSRKGYYESLVDKIGFDEDQLLSLYIKLEQLKTAYITSSQIETTGNTFYRLNEVFQSNRTCSTPLGETRDGAIRKLFDLTKRSARDFNQRLAGNTFEYLDSMGETKTETNSGGVYYVFLNIENPLIVDANGGDHCSVQYNNEEHNLVSLSEYAKEHGYDGAIVKNIYETTRPHSSSNLCTDFLPFYPNQIKYSSITYDDNSNLIPLSKRFDMSNPDIRY